MVTICWIYFRFRRCGRHGRTRCRVNSVVNDPLRTCSCAELLPLDVSTAFTDDAYLQKAFLNQARVRARTSGVATRLTCRRPLRMGQPSAIVTDLIGLLIELIGSLLFDWILHRKSRK
jgi:hypothetical protein